MRFETRRATKDEVIDGPPWYSSRIANLAYRSPVQYEQRWRVAQTKTVNM